MNSIKLKWSWSGQEDGEEVIVLAGSCELDQTRVRRTPALIPDRHMGSVRILGWVSSYTSNNVKMCHNGCGTQQLQKMCSRNPFLFHVLQYSTNVKKKKNSDNSTAPNGFSQTAPVVNPDTTYNLISSACKQSLSLGGEMMMELIEACCFTFYRIMYNYSHHLQQREVQLS